MLCRERGVLLFTGEGTRKMLSGVAMVMTLMDIEFAWSSRDYPPREGVINSEEAGAVVEAAVVDTCT